MIVNRLLYKLLILLGLLQLISTIHYFYRQLFWGGTTTGSVMNRKKDERCYLAVEGDENFDLYEDVGEYPNRSRYLYSYPARDMESFRKKYLDAVVGLTEDQEELNNIIENENEYLPNVKFYLNKTPSDPDNFFIKDFHDTWFGKYWHLEHTHSYIQWLFPIHEQGMNYLAVPLSNREIQIFHNNKELRDNLLKSFKIMLDFYGIELVEILQPKNQQEPQEQSTQQQPQIIMFRANNWEEQFKNLNRNTHNNLRITRILKCLGLLGLEQYQAPMVKFFLEETLVNKTLPRVKQSVLDYFIFCVVNEKERNELIKFAFQHFEQKEYFEWCPKNSKIYRKIKNNPDKLNENVSVKNEKIEDTGINTGTDSNKIEDTGINTGTDSNKIEDTGFYTGTDSNKIEDTGFYTGTDSNKIEDTGINTGTDSNKIEDTGINTGTDSNKIEDTGFYTGTDSNKIEDTGFYTGTDSNKIEDTGINTSTDSNKIEDTGINTGTDSNKIEDTGFYTGTDSNKIEDTGINTSTDSNKIEVAGFNAGTDSNKIEVAGINTGTDSNKIEDTGFYTGTDSNKIEDTGINTSTDSNKIEVAGFNAGTDSNKIEVAGFNAGTDSNKIEVAGINTSTDSNKIEVAGFIAGTDSNKIEVAGFNAGTDSNKIEVAGFNTSTDSNKIEVAGINTSTDSNKIEVAGINTGTDSNKIENTGVNNGSDTNKIEDTGTHCAKSEIYQLPSGTTQGSTCQNTTDDADMNTNQDVN